MQWSMPRKTLKIVAVLIGLAALGSLGLGLANAPQRGRLPGERAGGPTATIIEATEATPLSQERIEGPPPPPVLTAEQEAALEAERLAKEQEVQAQLAAAARPTTPAPTTTPAPDRLGDLLESVTPPPPPADDPPH